jgi:hypothetical protein
MAFDPQQSSHQQQFGIPSAASLLAEESASAFMAKVYRWMMAGLALSAGTAWFVASNQQAFSLVRGLFLPLVIAQLAVVFIFSMIAPKISGAIAAAMFGDAGKVLTLDLTPTERVEVGGRRLQRSRSGGALQQRTRVLEGAIAEADEGVDRDPVTQWPKRGDPGKCLRDGCSERVRRRQARARGSGRGKGTHGKETKSVND